MNKRTKWLLSIGVIATLVVGFQVAAFALAGSGFESADGNLADDATAGIDWNTFAPVEWKPHPATTNTRQATKTHAASGYSFTGIEDRQNTTQDSGFAGGTKQDDECATVGTAKASTKNDLTRIYLASKTDTTTGSSTFGHTFLNLAWVRIDQTGNPDAHIGFEFNQADTQDDPELRCLDANGNPEPGGLVQRTPGDVLVVYDFPGGSATPVITVREWFEDASDPDFEGCEVSSNSVPCWGESVNLTAAGFADAATNGTTTVVDALTPPALSSTTGLSVSSNLGESEFGEAGIDLTAADIIPAGSCKSFGNAFGVSRSSGESANAQMKDLVGPANIDVGNCGELTIIKRTDPRDLDEDFSFTSNIAGSEVSCSQDAVTDPATPGNSKAAFTLNDGSGDDAATPANEAAGDTADNTQHCVNIPPGSYTVTEGANPEGFDLTKIECTTGGTPTLADRKATITVAAGSNVTCVFTNTQQQGAIKVTKTSVKGDSPLAGATFEVADSADPPNVTELTTDENGEACVDGLAFGDYTVTETAAPDGYRIDDPDPVPVTVNNNAACDDDPYVGEGSDPADGLSFSDTPLSEIEVLFRSLAGEGVTAASIACTTPQGDPPVATAVAPVTENGAADPAFDDTDETITDLPPGTYNCQVVVDP